MERLTYKDKCMGTNFGKTNVERKMYGNTIFGPTKYGKQTLERQIAEINHGTQTLERQSMGAQTIETQSMGTQTLERRTMER